MQGEPHRMSLAFLLVLLFMQGVMLAYIGAGYAPVVDEVAHLPAGVRCVQFGDFSLYRVNPPLVKIIAALPAYFCDAEFDWTSASFSRIDRNEFVVGQDFLRLHGVSGVKWFVYGRWCCVGFAMLGTVGCWLWARELFGELSGCVAAVLWAFSPTVLAWGATILPDVAGASLGLIALWQFYQWLTLRTWGSLVLFGLLLGAAELSKMTWLILYPLLPVILLVDNRLTSRLVFAGSLQLATGIVLSLIVLNAAYGFHGTFTQLKDLDFQSKVLRSPREIEMGQTLGNRFRESFVGQAPVPLPIDYVHGADMQKSDFETGMESYLLGEWSSQGWKLYYLAALVFKEPIGLWVLVFLSSIVCIVAKQPLNDGFARASIVLCIPLITVFLLVSSQTGINRNLRYILPALPLLTIGGSALFRQGVGRTWKLAGALALLAAVTSVSIRFPHLMSYFNELCGGPLGGHRILMDANIDWGQDICRLKRWVELYPERQPLFVRCDGIVSPTDLGIRANAIAQETHDGTVNHPQPGWYIISRNHLHYRTDPHRYFREKKPVEYLGYSMAVFHVEPPKATSFSAGHCWNSEDIVRGLALIIEQENVGEDQCD
jgi:hypothetical protein